MQKQRIRIYDIENLPFAIHVTIRFVDGAEEKAIVYADNFAFENGNTIKFKNIGSIFGLAVKLVFYGRM